jgi:hypothetical protein
MNRAMSSLATGPGTPGGQNQHRGLHTATTPSLAPVPGTPASRKTAAKRPFEAPAGANSPGFPLNPPRICENVPVMYFQPSTRFSILSRQVS